MQMQGLWYSWFCTQTDAGCFGTLRNPTTSSQALASGAAQLVQPHAARLAKEQESPRELGNHSIAETMFAWAAPVSPHAASASEGILIFLQSPNLTNHFTMAMNLSCLGLLSSLQHTFDDANACSSCTFWTHVCRSLCFRCRVTVYCDRKPQFGR